jgi:alginate O-acetyltransferase complex protein AlgI
VSLLINTAAEAAKHGTAQAFEPAAREEVRGRSPSAAGVFAPRPALYCWFLAAILTIFLVATVLVARTNLFTRISPNAFNSYVFVFEFLPVALLGFYLATKVSARLTLGWLVAMSFIFYLAQGLENVCVFGGSLIGNYLAAVWIDKSKRTPKRQRLILFLAIAANLAVLGFYKYFFVGLSFLGSLGLTASHWQRSAFPLGISFFTFIQIGYLIDLQGGVAALAKPLQYFMFGGFFGHVTAGPILRQGEFMPQVAGKLELCATNVAVGASYFAMGMFKKAMADVVAINATSVFGSPSHVTMVAAWIGALSFAMQLYFDFSGYSDMAIGLARMFSIRYPFNFDSPYKAASIIDFWQRWHMTLTRYITAYLYMPISIWVSRHRVAARNRSYKNMVTTASGFGQLIATPMILTMLLTGIWHGAGLRYVVFGVLHGVYLSVNHAWRMLFKKRVQAHLAAWKYVNRLGKVGSVALVFLCALVADVFFRAESCRQALTLLGAMAGRNGNPAGGPSMDFYGLLTLGLLLLATWTLPNSREILESDKATISGLRVSLPHWQPNLAWGLALAVLLGTGLYGFTHPREFLYFHF